MVNSEYICQNCGASYPKWQGRCDSCSSWNSLLETSLDNKKKKTRVKTKDLSNYLVSEKNLTKLNRSFQRFPTYINEFDRCLGGNGENFGITRGSVILLSGEPGIGKSTLLTKVVINLLLKTKKFKIFYICGEENPDQVSLRVNRLKNNDKEDLGDRLIFVTSTDVEIILELMKKEKPDLVVVDSIQTIYTSDLSSSIGSLSQVKECAQRLTKVAKDSNIPLFLIGHLTKDGSIAGPKTLEHLVDTVLELTGERFLDLRVLRALKNRFGSTNEVGIFKMAEFGLEEVDDIGSFFLSDQNKTIGNAIACVMEGVRPLLIQVEALVIASQLTMPRRVGRGVEVSRIQVLSAVLQKYTKMPLGLNDIFVSVVGGLNVKEPGIDLALLVSLVSSLLDKELPKKSVFIGEVGLLGEIKPVSNLDRRIKEVKRLGFTKIFSVKNFKNVMDLLKELKFK
jgi:DNA repair protein RadA/Sms